MSIRQQKAAVPKKEDVKIETWREQRCIGKWTDGGVEEEDS